MWGERERERSSSKMPSLVHVVLMCIVLVLAYFALPAYSRKLRSTGNTAAADVVAGLGRLLGAVGEKNL